MRDIDLNQFWPQYAPAPPRLPAIGPAAETHGNDVPYGRGNESAPPIPRTVHAPFDHEAAIQEALAAKAAARVPVAEATRDAGPVAPFAINDREPAQFVLDLPSAEAREHAVFPIAAGTLSTPPSKTEKPPAASAVRDTPPARKRRDFTPVLWGGSGFIAGALVWHIVGFWMFVSDVVLNANDPRARTLEAFLPGLSTPAPGQKAMSRIPESAVIAAPAAFKHATAGTQFACVSLALDRSAGITQAQICKGRAADLRDAGFNRGRTGWPYVRACKILLPGPIRRRCKCPKLPAT